MRGVIARSLVVAIATGCFAADDGGGRWHRVAVDPNYVIYIDTMVELRRDGSFETTFRTDHEVPRLRDGKPFDREIVTSIVRCDSLWFKVRSVDMSLGDARPIAQQRDDEWDISEQPWRRVEQGTSEHIAAEAACHYGRKRFPKGRFSEPPRPQSARKLP